MSVDVESRGRRGVPSLFLRPARSIAPEHAHAATAWSRSTRRRGRSGCRCRDLLVGHGRLSSRDDHHHRANGAAPTGTARASRAHEAPLHPSGSCRAQRNRFTIERGGLKGKQPVRTIRTTVSDVPSPETVGEMLAAISTRIVQLLRENYDAGHRARSPTPWTTASSASCATASPPTNGRSSKAATPAG